VVEGKSLNDVMTSLIKTLEKAAINDVFGSIFNPTSAGGTSIFGSILKSVIPGFASGTDNAPGGLSWVGENGPELMNVPKGSQIIPSSVSRQITGGGSTTVQYNIDASGADSGTVARIQTVLAQHARAIGAQGRALTSSQRLQATGVG
jgi:phage-related tail protein